MSLSGTQGLGVFPPFLLRVWLAPSPALLVPGRAAISAIKWWAGQQWARALPPTLSRDPARQPWAVWTKPPPPSSLLWAQPIKPPSTSPPTLAPSPDPQSRNGRAASVRDAGGPRAVQWALHYQHAAGG